jgi:hypothetical protein
MLRRLILPVVVAASLLGEDTRSAVRVTGVRAPLSDMGGGTYLGYPGGLYPDGRNVPPKHHAAAGRARAAQVAPLDTGGNPSPSGKYVLLSIGMSNTTQEFCSQGGGLPCDAWTFMGQAAADPEVEHGALVMANGALGGRTASFWDSPSDPDYNRVRDTVLAPQGLSERQVQIVWVKVANANPQVSLPAEASDALLLETQMGHIVRALKVRYPNLRQVFLSSRIYAGYATTTLNPEPYAYESAFAVKWLVESQVRQMAGGLFAVDSRAGNLHYDSPAPWIAWGPYLWADGLHPRSDGLIWEPADLASDGTHPSASGEYKVGRMLLDFFKGSPFSRCWFVEGEICS